MEAASSRQVADILDGSRPPPRPREGRPRDAEIGCAAGIEGMLDEAALVTQHLGDGLLEA